MLRRNLRVSAKGCRRFGRFRICWWRCFTRACTGSFSRWSTCWSCELLAQPLAGIGFTASMLILAFTMLGSALQLPGVGGGAQLATFVVLTRMYAIPQEPAAATAIILWLITFSAACIAGVPLLIHEGWSMGDLRRMARAETAAEDAGTHVTEVCGGTAQRNLSLERIALRARWLTFGDYLWLRGLLALLQRAIPRLPRQNPAS